MRRTVSRALVPTTASGRSIAVSLVKFGYPPKPLPSSVTGSPTAQLSSIPITKGEQIVVTERSPTMAHNQFTTGSTPREPTQSNSGVVPPPHPVAPASNNVFETAPTPRSTTSTATHTPTPAPSVPRTIMPSPYIYNYPGTGPGSAASSTGGASVLPHVGGSTLAVPQKGGPLGSSPLAERNHHHPGLSSAATAREADGYSGEAHEQHLGADNALTELESRSGKPTFVHVNDGMGSVLVHRIVPDDNSCLFSAIGLVFKGKYDDAITKELREGKYKCVHRALVADSVAFLCAVVASEIRKDPINYSDVILGQVARAPARRTMLTLTPVNSRGRDEYIETIQKPSSWGGAIELSILAKQCVATVSVSRGVYTD